MKELEVLLKTVGDGLKMLAQGMNIIADKLDHYAETKKGDTIWDSDETGSKEDFDAEPAPQKSSLRAKRPVSNETKEATATNRVLEVLSQAEAPMDIQHLAEKTGFEKKKLHNVLFRLKKQGRIENVSKGVYRKAS